MTLSALGIFSAAGAGVGFVDAYELIATAFGTGSSGTITFSSIPSTYKHLEIRYTAKNTATNRLINLTFNGITNPYRLHRLSGNGSVVFSSESGTAPAIEMADFAASSTTTGAVSAGVINILDYASSSKITTIRALAGQAGAENSTHLASGALFNTTAITSLTFTTGSGSFATTTRFSLYGIKG